MPLVLVLPSHHVAVLGVEEKCSDYTGCRPHREEELLHPQGQEVFLRAFPGASSGRALRQLLRVIEFHCARGCLECHFVLRNVAVSDTTWCQDTACIPGLCYIVQF